MSSKIGRCGGSLLGSLDGTSSRAVVGVFMAVKLKIQKHRHIG
jgi:hypothetical protein